jgi:hypothetical protein
LGGATVAGATTGAATTGAAVDLEDLTGCSTLEAALALAVVVFVLMFDFLSKMVSFKLKTVFQIIALIK